MDQIGVVDTMFARVDMGAVALDELRSCPGYGTRFDVVYRTVPGFKDLAVECKRLVEQEGCRILVALGMPGKAAIDQVCAHEASQGLMLAQLATSTHILEVFVHENEEEDPAALGEGLRGPRPQARPQRVLDVLRAGAAHPAGRPGRAPGLLGRGPGARRRLSGRCRGGRLGRAVRLRRGRTRRRRARGPTGRRRGPASCGPRGPRRRPSPARRAAASTASGRCASPCCAGRPRPGSPTS